MAAAATSSSLSDCHDASTLRRPPFLPQISTHAQSLPTGLTFGARPFPSVYRTIGLSATVRRRLFSPPQQRRQHVQRLRHPLCCPLPSVASPPPPWRCHFHHTHTLHASLPASASAALAPPLRSRGDLRPAPLHPHTTTCASTNQLLHYSHRLRPSATVHAARPSPPSSPHISTPSLSSPPRPQPARLFRTTEGAEDVPEYLLGSRGGGLFAQLGGGNHLKALLCADPQSRVLSTASAAKAEKYRDTWRRFALANVSPALQIALSERAAGMMARRVDIRNVAAAASSSSLADEAGVALAPARPCWPVTAKNLLGSLFFRVALQGPLAAAASFPCTLLVDAIRLVRCAAPPAAFAGSSRSPENPRWLSLL